MEFMPEILKVFRISLKRHLSDLSGEGARLYGGRWNSEGISMLYTSESASLALLEFVCNSNNMLAAKEVGLAEIRIPAETKMAQISSNELPAEWNKYPGPPFLKNMGDHWIKENKTLGLKVPSAIIGIEQNVLLNPKHPDFKLIQFQPIHDFNFDHRLTKK